MTALDKKDRSTLSKSVLNIFRTTMRNNIELTHIADNKANVLLSLNALMITFLIPFVIPYFDIVQKFRLGIPILVLVITCLVVIYICALVLKPSKFFQNQKQIEEGKYMSPFFFGNFYKMNREEYGEYIKNALSEGELVKNHITEDLHYIGTRLGRKMSLIRIAFNIFLFGLFSAMSMAFILIFIYQ